MAMVFGAMAASIGFDRGLGADIGRGGVTAPRQCQDRRLRLHRDKVRWAELEHSGSPARMRSRAGPERRGEKEACRWWRKWGALPICILRTSGRETLALHRPSTAREPKESGALARSATFLQIAVDSPARADLYTAIDGGAASGSCGRSSF